MSFFDELRKSTQAAPQRIEEEQRRAEARKIERLHIWARRCCREEAQKGLSHAVFVMALDDGSDGCTSLFPCTKSEVEKYAKELVRLLADDGLHDVRYVIRKRSPTIRSSKDLDAIFTVRW